MDFLSVNRENILLILVEIEKRSGKSSICESKWFGDNDIGVDEYKEIESFLLENGYIIQSGKKEPRLPKGVPPSTIDQKNMPNIYILSSNGKDLLTSLKEPKEFKSDIKSTLNTLRRYKLRLNNKSEEYRLMKEIIEQLKKEGGYEINEYPAMNYRENKSGEKKKPPSYPNPDEVDIIIEKKV